MNMEVFMRYVTYLLMAIGVLAFMTSAIVQVIKRDAVSEKIQTNVVALVAAMIITPVAVVILCIYYKITIEWYYVLLRSWRRLLFIWFQPAAGKK